MIEDSKYREMQKYRVKKLESLIIQSSKMELIRLLNELDRTKDKKSEEHSIDVFNERIDGFIRWMQDLKIKK